MGASASISDTNETGNRILKNTRRSFHGGVEARFIDMSLIEACSNSLESYAPASVASPADSKKFLDKMQESNNATLSKEKVVEVVKWMMRNVDNEVCMERILNFFENCAEDEMTYEEFSNLYEEISTRTELQVFFEEAFNNLDVERTGRLHKNEIVKLTGIVLSQFASLWCTKREMAEMRKKLAQQFVRVDIMEKEELYEVYDSMLISIRLIVRTKQKFKEFDTENQGRLGEHGLLKLSEWILKSYRRSGVPTTQDGIEEMKQRILDEYGVGNNGYITISELASLFEDINEKKQQFSVLTHSDNKGPGRVNYYSQRLRGSYSEISVSESKVELPSVDITPAVEAKFKAMAVLRPGVLSRQQLRTLIDDMFKGRNEEGNNCFQALDANLDNHFVSFDEFKSKYQDLQIRERLNNSFAQSMFAHGSNGFLPLSKLSVFVDEVLCSAERLGCSVEQRSSTRDQIVLTFTRLYTIKLSSVELSELFDEIVQVTKIIQGSIQKFKQLDIDGSGTLEGGEVNLLADWILTEMESNETSPTGHDRNVLKDKIFARFNKGEKDTITLGEMALLNEELMKKKTDVRLAKRYKSQVKLLLLNMLEGT